MHPKPVIRFISGNGSSEDRQFVEQWIKEDPARAETISELEAVWKKTGHLGLTDQDSIDEAWDKLQAEMKGRPAYSATDTVKPLKAIRSQTPKWKILLRVAAILLIGFGLYSAYDYYGGLTSSASISDSIAIKTIKAEYGQQIKFT